MTWLLALLVQAEACDSCHGEQLGDYSGSVHHKKGLDCHSCHGTDVLDSMRAAEGKSPHLKAPTFFGKPKDMAAFCARCHAGVAEHFSAGKHAPKMDCLACHKHHATEPADFATTGKWCFSCHKQDMKGVDEIRSMLGEARSIRPRSTSLSNTPGVPSFELRAEEIQALVASLGELQHGVDRKALGGVRDRASKLSSELSASIQSHESEVARRPLYLIGFLVLWLATGFLAAAWVRKRSEA